MAVASHDVTSRRYFGLRNMEDGYVRCIVYRRAFPYGTFYSLSILASFRYFFPQLPPYVGETREGLELHVALERPPFV